MASASDRLTAHFTYGELRAHIAPANVLPRLQALAQYLEIVRGILGVPLQVNSGYRSPAYNMQVGGSPTSSHVQGDAGDVKPLGISQWTAYNRLNAAIKAGQLPAWDQIIFYPVSGHIHIGIGPQKRREVRIRAWEGREGSTQYPLLTVADTTHLQGAPPNGATRDGATDMVVIFAVAFLALALIFANT